MEVESYKKIKVVLWLILFANVGVALLKIIIGSAIKSASMTADGFHSMSDGASNIVGLIGISIASKPRDKEHPYGHKKFEVMASMFIGTMLVLMGGKIIIEVIERFNNPVIPSISIESLIVLVVTLIINIGVCSYEKKQGEKLNSYILISDSKHTKSDIFVSVGVLITLIGVKLGLPPIVDTITSLIVSIFILQAAYEIFKESIDILVDKIVLDEDSIREIVEEFNEVKGVHNIRSRGSKNDIHIDMHILVDPFISIEKSHILAHDIEDTIKERLQKNIQVIVHIEPYYS